MEIDSDEIYNGDPEGLWTSVTNLHKFSKALKVAHQAAEDNKLISTGSDDAFYIEGILDLASIRKCISRSHINIAMTVLSQLLLLRQASGEWISMYVKLHGPFDLWKRCFRLCVIWNGVAGHQENEHLVVTLLRYAHHSFGPVSKTDVADKYIIAMLKESQDVDFIKIAFEALLEFRVQMLVSQHAFMRIFCKSEEHFSVLESFIAGLLEYSSQQKLQDIVGRILLLGLRHDQNSVEPKVPAETIALFTANLIRKKGFTDKFFQDFVIRPLNQNNPDVYYRLLLEFGAESFFSGHYPPNKDYNFLISLLTYGQKEGLIKESHQRIDLSMYESRLFNDLKREIIVIDIDILCKMMLYNHDECRLFAMEVLLTSQMLTHPLKPISLEGLITALPTLALEHDRKTREDIFRILTSFFKRMRASIAKLYRPFIKQPLLEKSGLQWEMSEEIRILFFKFIDLTMSYLRPESGYQKQIFALRVLQILTNMGLARGIHSTSKLNLKDWPFTKNLYNQSTNRNLVDLLMNSFEDIRDLAALCLQNAIDAHYDSITSDIMSKQWLAVLRQAELMSKATGRADHGHGLGKIFELCLHLNVKTASYGCTSNHYFFWLILRRPVYNLERGLIILKQDQQGAISRYPIHSTFTSLRLMIESSDFRHDIPKLPGMDNDEAWSPWFASLDEVLKHMKELWKYSSETLCNEAPEGYFPGDFDHTGDLGTKDILSYTWRSLKEASLLLGSVIKANVHRPVSSLTQNFLIYDLVFEQLAMLHHTGALGSLAQSWADCCASKTFQEVLPTYYEKFVKLLKSPTSIITRRSAGIPFIFLGMLASQNGTIAQRNLLQQALADLNDCINPNGQEESSELTGILPQVHALHCLRALFGASFFNGITLPYVSTIITLCTECLSSDVWAIRNGALMLMRVLIVRIIPNNIHMKLSTEKTMELFADKSLSRAILSLLAGPISDVKSSSHVVQKVFPALAILQKISPTAELSRQLMNIVLLHTSSSHWHVRDMAARVVSSLAVHTFETGGTIEDDKNIIKRMITECFTSKSHNFIHGRLLCAKYLMIDLKSTLYPVDELLETLHDEAIPILYTHNSCPFTKVAFIDIWIQFYLCPQGRVWEVPPISIVACTKAIMVALTLPKIRVAGIELLSVAVLKLRFLCLMEFKYAITHVLNLSMSVQNHHQYESEFSIELQNFRKNDAAGFSIFCDALLEMQAAPVIVKRKWRFLVYELSEFLFNTSQECSQSHEGPAELLFLLLDQWDGNVLEEIDFRWDNRLIELISGSSGTVVAPRVLQYYMQIWVRAISLSSDSSLDKFRNVILYVFRFTSEETFTFLRESAVACLRSFPEISLGQLNIIHDSVLREYYLLIFYEFLQNDDADIRKAAAIHASTLFEDACYLGPKALHTMTFEAINDLPIVSQFMMDTAIQKMTGTKIWLEKNILMPRSMESIRTASSDTMALFEIERQNLYIDRLEESKMWKEFLLKHAPSGKNLKAMYNFAVDGFICLCKLLQENETSTPKEWPWMFNRDMYIIIQRLLNTAEVVLNWKHTQLLVLMLGKFMMIGNERKLQRVHIARAKKLLELKCQSMVSAIALNLKEIDQTI